MSCAHCRRLNSDDVSWGSDMAKQPRHGGAVVVCDVSRLPADVTTVDLVARRQLAARRNGDRMVLHGAGPGLLELLELAGLRDLVGND